jgi:hypothetical protein
MVADIGGPSNQPFNSDGKFFKKNLTFFKLFLKIIP